MRRILLALLTCLALIAPGALVAATASDKSDTQGANEPASRAAPGLRVTARGWGALKVGMTHREAFATGMVSRRPGRCAPGYQMKDRFEERGFAVWRGSYPRFKVDQIVVWGGNERTKRGIHVGSTLRQLRGAYPGVSKVLDSSFEPGGRGKDLYLAYVKKRRGVMSFQFAYAGRPKASSHIEAIIIDKEPAVYFGC